MADRVIEIMEAMIPEFEDLRKRGLCSPAEVKALIKRRENAEYSMNRRQPARADFLTVQRDYPEDSKIIRSEIMQYVQRHHGKYKEISEAKDNTIAEVKATLPHAHPHISHDHKEHGEALHAEEVPAE